MMRRSPLFLATFHQSDRRVFRGKRAPRSRFGHTFGGPAEYDGRRAYRGQPPVHLLMRLNTADPAVGVTLPCAEWLPLLCAVRYGACDLGYRVVSDSKVKILHQEEKKAWGDFPYDGYPEHLPASPLTFEDGGYDPTDPEKVLFYAGVFGYDALTPEQFASLARRVEKEGVPEMCGYETGEDYLRDGNCMPYTQGAPVEDCPDPKCDNHGRAKSLRTFALFREADAKTRPLWGRNCGSLQIIYQICPACSAVRTTNQCT